MRERASCARKSATLLSPSVPFGQWLIRYWTRELHEALELADELLAAAEDVKDPAMLLAGNTRAASSFFLSASWSSANEHLEKALAVFDLRQPLSAELEAQRLGAFIHLYLGLYGLGYPDRAWAKSREMMEVAQRCSAPFVLAQASCSVPEHHLLRGDSTTAQKCAEEAMALSRRVGTREPFGNRRPPIMAPP